MRILLGPPREAGPPRISHPVYVVAALDALSVGIILPALPHLAAWGAAQFLSAPLMGSLADRFGRRPVLLVALAGLAADALFMAVAPSLTWLLVGRAISGALAASVIACSAHVIDVSLPEERARRLGLLSAAWSIGLIAGPPLGGGLADIHMRLPFVVCALSAAATWLYAALRLKESLPADRRRSLSPLRQAWPFRGVIELLGRPGLRAPALVFGLAALADQALPTFFVLCVIERYGWSVGAAGLALTALGVGRIVVQAFGVERLVRRYGEPPTLIFGLMSLMLALLVLGLAPDGKTFLAALPLYAAGAVGAPTLATILSMRVSDAQQGQLQGANTALQGAASAIGPLIFGGAYSLAAGPLASAPRGAGAMLLAGALCALATGVAWASVSKRAADRR